MSFSARRRLWQSSCESSPLEMDFDRANYSTFAARQLDGVPHWLSLLSSLFKGNSLSRKNDLSKKWTLLIVIVAILLVCLHKVSKTSAEAVDQFLPGEVWDRNHYNSGRHKATQQNFPRNLLIVQLSKAGMEFTWSEITSKPNRAYARLWNVDYLLYYKQTNNACLEQSKFVWNLFKHQQREANEPMTDDLPRPAVYDTVLFLSPDAIITDLDYDILSLLPADMLASVTTNNKLSILNLFHSQFPTLAKLWLDSGCDESSASLKLKDLAESVATSDTDESNDVVSMLSASSAGFVEPRLVKFLVADEPTTETSAKLQTTAESVCYRYYPRCDVL